VPRQLPKDLGDLLPQLQSLDITGTKCDFETVLFVVADVWLGSLSGRRASLGRLRITALRLGKMGVTDDNVHVWTWLYVILH
jgi:hypothetical protein